MKTQWHQKQIKRGGYGLDLSWHIDKQKKGGGMVMSNIAKIGGRAKPPPSPQSSGAFET